MTRLSSAAAPGPARVIVVAAGAALAASQFFRAASRADGRPWLVVLVACIALPVLLLHVRFALAEEGPRRAPSLRIPVVQTLLSLLAALPFGITAGLSSIPVAGFLLYGSGRRQRAPAACAVAIAVCAFAGLDIAQAASVRDVVDLVITTMLGGGLLYGLTRLGSLVVRVNAARVSLAGAAAASERLRISESVRRGLDGDLSRLCALAEAGRAAELVTNARQSLARARAAAADLRSLSLAPEIASARALLGAAGIRATVRVGHVEPLGGAGSVLAAALRDAVTDVVRRGTARTCEITTVQDEGRIVLRVSNDGARTADRGIDALASAAERTSAAGGRIGAGLVPSGWFTVEVSAEATPQEPRVPTDPEYRLALSLFGVALIALCVKTILYMPQNRYPEAVVCLAVICTLQVRFSLHDARRGGRLGLAVTAVLAFAPLTAFGPNWIAVPGFLAGSLPMALRPRTALPLAGSAVALSGVMTGAHSHSTSAGVDAGISVLVTGLLVYGLLRLARLLRDLREAEDGLSRDASVHERLRVARDLHDLLGHNLAGILLKGELAVRLEQRDPARASAELDEIPALTRKAREELGSVLGGATRLDFERELSSAASILTAAGIATEVETSNAALSAEASAALGAVLREAVTNVLRHSSARCCEITLRVAQDAVRLEVANDGVRGGVTPPGSGSAISRSASPNSAGRSRPARRTAGTCCGQRSAA